LSTRHSGGASETTICVIPAACAPWIEPYVGITNQIDGREVGDGVSPRRTAGIDESDQPLVAKHTATGHAAKHHAIGHHFAVFCRGPLRREVGKGERLVPGHRPDYKFFP
jgi:hypothetical protein